MAKYLDFAGLQYFAGKVQAALNGKAASTHTHTIANVEGLQTALDEKAVISDMSAYLLKTGGTLTGNLTIKKTLPSLKLQNTSSSRTADVNVLASGVAVFSNTDSNDGTNYTDLRIDKQNANPEDLVKICVMNNGLDASYRLYGEHHKPTAAEVTAGTFAGQVVAKSDAQTPGTSLLRNSQLATAEGTPTNNGEIIWVYE